MQNIASMELRRSSGEAVVLGDFIDRPTILVLTRYYG